MYSFHQSFLTKMGSLPLETFKPLDTNNFSDESHLVIDFISKYYKQVENYPVLSQVKPGYLFNHSPLTPPCCPESLETILKDVQMSILPGITHWQSPNFFAYFQANASNAGFLGEMLCTGLNVVGFNWISSPAATELEMVVMEWMGNMLKLPQMFLFSGSGGGVLHGSTCEAIVCTLAAARDKALALDKDNMITKFVVYASDQTHFTVQKASKLVGIPPSNFRALRTSSSTSFALSPTDVKKAMQKDIANGLIPLFLCATVGTTSSGAVDPLEGLGQMTRKYGVWLHVDAAYAGSACMCPEFRRYLDGVESADSISLNPHKWFLTNMDCCCLWVKEPKHLVDSLSTDPEILKNKASESNQVVDYKDWQIAQSRRFRAMKLWVVIRRYGVDNLRNHIREDVKLAKQFEGLIRKDDRFEVVVPRMFALVCFRLKVGKNRDSENNEMNRRLLEAVNCSGRAFMTHAILSGIYVLRCAIGATMTEEQHVDALWTLIQEKTTDTLLVKNDA